MSGGETHAELTEIFLCKPHRGDRKERGNKRERSVQECVYVFMYACLLVCAHRRPRGMEGIPCSLLRRWKDLEEGAGHWLSWRDCQSSEEETQQVSHNIHIPYASRVCLLCLCFMAMRNQFSLWSTRATDEVKNAAFCCCVLVGGVSAVMMCEGLCQRLMKETHKQINTKTQTDRETEAERETEVLTATNSRMCFLCVLSSLLPVLPADARGDCTRPAGVKGLEGDTNTGTYKHTVHNTTPHIHINQTQHNTWRNTKQIDNKIKAGTICVWLWTPHLTEVMIFFRLLEVKGFPLFFTRSCQQVVKHMVVPTIEKRKEHVTFKFKGN